ncbi:MAG: glycosyltransferase family 4 protein [Chloroflexota bacterium]
MKKVLVLAYYFPPTGGAGVWRTLKFVKYLPAWGWKPMVVTPRNPDYPYHDPSLLQEVPLEAEVHRVSSIELGRWYRRLMKKLALPRHKDAAADPQPTSPQPPRPKHPFFRLARDLVYNFIFVPDFHIGWIPFAVVRGLSLLRRHNIDVVYATGNPFSTFLAGLWISLLSGKPLVLDMRDPWALNPYYPQDRSGALHRFWERRCISRARRVLFVGDGFCQGYREYYRDMPQEKFTFITHGYDSDDFQSLVPCKGDRFTISHIGTLTSLRTPDALFQAVRKLLGEQPELEARICIRFVGAESYYAKEVSRALGLQKVVEIIPYVDHRASLQYMLDSHVLLLLSYHLSNPLLTSITGKVYEYLASGVPILALTPEAGAASMIREARAGMVVDPDDPVAIKEALFRMYQDYERGEESCATDMAYVQRFDRKVLAGELSSLLDEVAGHE